MFKEAVHHMSKINVWLIWWWR